MVTTPTEAQVAGRELDAMVAERIMGWTWNDKSAWSPSGGRWARLGRDPWEWLPAYSTDIQAAWEVVEKFVASGVVFIVKGDGLRTGDHNPKWTVLVGNQPRIDADTAPLTICLAALQAVAELDRRGNH